MIVPALRGQVEWENPVKKLLREGKPVIGATLTVASPEIAARQHGLRFPVDRDGA